MATVATMQVCRARSRRDASDVTDPDGQRREGQQHEVARDDAAVAADPQVHWTVLRRNG